MERLIEMRLREREITDKKEIEEILSRAPVGRLGLAWNNKPYIVPVHFVYDEDKIFFHSASEGRKIENIKVNPNVCFEVDEFQEIIVNPNPCETETKYKSVIAFGTAKIVTDKEVKLQALRKLLTKYGVKGEHLTLEMAEKFKSSLGSKAEVIEIKIEEITGKKT